MKTLCLLAMLMIASCGWRTEYGKVQTTTAVVSDRYHRAARYSYEPWNPQGHKHRFYPAVWRVELYAESINITFTLHSEADYHALHQNEKVKINYREQWNVQYKDDKEVQRRFYGYTLDSYSK